MRATLAESCVLGWPAVFPLDVEKSESVLLRVSAARLATASVPQVAAVIAAPAPAPMVGSSPVGTAGTSRSTRSVRRCRALSRRSTVALKAPVRAREAATAPPVLAPSRPVGAAAPVQGLSERAAAAKDAPLWPPAELPAARAAPAVVSRGGDDDESVARGVVVAPFSCGDDGAGEESEEGASGGAEAIVDAQAAP